MIKYYYMLYLTINKKGVFMEELKIKTIKSSSAKTASFALSIFLFVWMMVNTYLIFTVDPYPFILLNLILSCVAAIQAPIIMMSQNREAKKERIKSMNEYKTTLKSELILEDLHDTMDQILKNQKEILKYINEKEKN